jgi:hypothetical protein
MSLDYKFIRTPQEFSNLFEYTDFWDKFAEAYQDSPWNEYMYCPRCKPADDYGPLHSYGILFINENHLSKCPVCGTPLVFYWSRDRILRYFRTHSNNFLDNPLLLLASENGKPVGFIFGFVTKSVGTKDVVMHINNLPGRRAFYIDLFFLLKEHRRSKSLKNVFQMGSIYLLSRKPFINSKVFQSILNMVGIPLVFSLFSKLLIDIANRDIYAVITRTHRKAKKVKLILQITGFHSFNSFSDEDKEREYFYKDLDTKSYNV